MSGDTGILKEAEILQAVQNRCRPVKSQDVKLLKWKTISLNDEGKLGYLGDHFRVQATVKLNNQEENIAFFVKTKPINKVQSDLVEAGKMYIKETLFYNKVAGKLTDILSKVRPIGEQSKVSVIPKCYLATDSLFIMDDLEKYDFKGKPADVPLTLEEFSVSLRALARFHAASIYLEEQVGKPLVKEYPELDFETFLNDSPDHILATWHAASIDAAITLIAMVDKYKDKPAFVKKAQEAMPGLVKELMTKAQAWPNTKNVFCHGDLWTNNLLFRMDQNNKPVEAVLVDFQLLRYAPPATDILIFLMFSADKAFRDKHCDTVIGAYYDEMSTTLQDLGLKPEKVLPWENFVSTLKEMQKYALVLMALEYPLALAPSEIMDPILRDDEKYRQFFLVNRTATAVHMFKTYQSFRSRYTEVIEELIDNYIINI